VKEKRIELLRQARQIPSEELMRSRPSKGERVPTLEPGEVVVFFEHFRRDFTLPTSNFLRQFLEHFRL
jgi:hypothetical protein